MRNAIVVPVMIGALGTISDKFERHFEKLGVKVVIDIILKTVLLGSARILQKVYLFRDYKKGTLRPLVA